MPEVRILQVRRPRPKARPVEHVEAFRPELQPPALALDRETARNGQVLVQIRKLPQLRIEPRCIAESDVLSRTQHSLIGEWTVARRGRDTAIGHKEIVDRRIELPAVARLPSAIRSDV